MFTNSSDRWWILGCYQRYIYLVDPWLLLTVFGGFSLLPVIYSWLILDTSLYKFNITDINSLIHRKLMDHEY